MQDDKSSYNQALAYGMAWAYGIVGILAALVGFFNLSPFWLTAGCVLGVLHQVRRARSLD